MKIYNPWTVLALAAFVSGCSSEPSGTSYVAVSAPPDKTVVRVHAYDHSYAPTVFINPRVAMFDPTVVINGSGKGTGKGGYRWEDAVFGPQCNANISFDIFRDANGRMYDPRVEKPRRIDIYYCDDKKHPVHWGVGLKEQN